MLNMFPAPFAVRRVVVKVGIESNEDVFLVTWLFLTVGGKEKHNSYTHNGRMTESTFVPPTLGHQT
jgi:hypothetical protein